MNNVDFEKEILNNLVDNDKLNQIEQQFNSSINNLEKKLKNKISNIQNIVEGKPLQINLGTIEQPKNELVHKCFHKIIRVLQSAKRINKHIQLVGPAGSSKTTLTRQVANAIGIDYLCMSVGQQTTVSNLLGYMSATGQYISTPLRDAFENGKLICLDEFDTANPSTVTILNALLANDICSFPDKIVNKHPNFICIICCNTYGYGGDINYIGRNRLDSATLDRFVTIEVDYDEELENKLANHPDWFKIVKKIRENVQKQGLKVVVSPRASMQGADLLDADFGVEEVLDMVILKGVSQDVKSQMLKDVSFSKINKKSNKMFKPIDIYIDFDKMSYTCSNVIENTSFLAQSDWASDITIFISSGIEYKSSLSGKFLYLNSGIDMPMFDSREHDTTACIEYLIYELKKFSEQLKTKYQDVVIKIVWKGKRYIFGLNNDNQEV